MHIESSVQSCECINVLSFQRSCGILNFYHFVVTSNTPDIKLCSGSNKNMGQSTFVVAVTPTLRVIGLPFR